MQDTIPLDELVREYFTDVCIDKRLSRQVAGTDRAVPDFVSDWLVSRYTTDGLPDEAKINAFLARHLPERKQKNTLLNELRVGGSLKILDAYSVRVDLKKSRLVLEIPCLDIRDASVRDDIVDLNPLLLVGNVWGSGTIVQRPKDDKPEENEVCMVDFAPMQTSIVELDYYIEVRKQFTLDQWRELLVRSMGYNPDSYSLDEQSHLLTRLTPLVQPRVNLIELAPKGTGKSYVFSRLSRHAWLISGGVVTRAQMFYNMQSRTAGVITRYDAVVLDEVQTIRFAEEGELIGAFKGYLEQGEFRVMGYRGTADAGLVLLANIPITSAGRPRDSELFKTLPSWLQGISATALLDRFHGLVPGWELQKIRTDSLCQGMALKADYLGEVMHALRGRGEYRQWAKDHIESEGSIRDIHAVERLSAAYLKLLFPSLETVTPELFEMHCLRPAKALRRRIREQLAIADDEYTPALARIDLRTN